jgi:hypothetical protein
LTIWPADSRTTIVSEDDRITTIND